jgi:hypothetical protein
VSGKLVEVWEELEGGALQEGITARRFMPEAPIDVFVGLQKKDRVRLVFVQASPSSFATWEKGFPEAAGFTVRLEPVAGAESSVRLVVRLATRAYQDVFTALVNDLLTSLTGAPDERSAVVGFVLRLERWQRFLARHGSEGLSALEQRGLYGELWFLREYVLAAYSSAEALEAWTGPQAADQDFQFPSCSVEVKTSAGNPDQSVHISNVRQLDNSAKGHGVLYLLHVALDERHAQGESLVRIVEEIKGRLGDQAGRFNERLLEAGYVDLHTARYSATQYVAKAHQFFEVAGKFPRILESELRAGVGGIKYFVAIAACAPFLVANSKVTAAIASPS